MNVSKRLRPGRHQLSRDEVQTHQRERIFLALETEMSAKGYADTSVADVIKSAGAIAARLALQQQFVDGVAAVFDAQSEQERFGCQVLVAAISTLVTNALEEDPRAVLDLYEPLNRVARQLMAGE
ncbi:MAG TPA: hypothetical protein VET27_17490 [Mycobacterium sp.]|nr:hypothetical protein [Mycobacterium sp.]